MQGIEKKKGYYDDSKRIEVATLFACLGDPDKVCELTKVPAQIIRGWRQTDWFKALLEEIRSENNELLDSKFTLIVQKSQDLILDRLENGDIVITKEGNQVRKPVSARDLALVGAITVDKRQIIRKEPTSISQNKSESSGVSEEKILKLAQLFKQLTDKKEIKPVVEPTDIVFEEVVTDAEKTGESIASGGAQEGPVGE